MQPLSRARERWREPNTLVYTAFFLAALLFSGVMQFLPSRFREQGFARGTTEEAVFELREA